MKTIIFVVYQVVPVSHACSDKSVTHRASHEDLHTATLPAVSPAWDEAARRRSTRQLHLVEQGAPSPSSDPHITAHESFFNIIQNKYFSWSCYY